MLRNVSCCSQQGRQYRVFERMQRHDCLTGNVRRLEVIVGCMRVYTRHSKTSTVLCWAEKLTLDIVTATTNLRDFFKKYMFHYGLFR